VNSIPLCEAHGFNDIGLILRDDNTGWSDVVESLDEGRVG
jgi:hypothetical protein